MLDFFKEFFRFMMTRKKYWLVPILLAFLLVGSLIVLTKGSAVAPFVYTVF